MTSRVLGLDYGTKRVGIAVSDPLQKFAHPLEVVAKTEAVRRVRALSEEYELDLIVIGMPTSLSGEEGLAAAAAQAFGKEIAAATGQKVVFVDERFSSKSAEHAMIEAGVKRRRRRETLDKAAAAIILQSFLDRPQ